MRKVTLHTGSARISKILKEEFTEKGTKFVIVDDVEHMPATADLVLSIAATNSKDEWTAARLGCMVAVLPEALGYVRNLLDRNGSLVLVGADRGRGA